MSNENHIFSDLPKARLMVVSGASGSGKSTVVKHLAAHPAISPLVSVSVTTREPRPGEVHGREYFFLSRDEFEGLKAANELLEYAEVHGNAYGTPAGPVMKQINEGGLAVLEIDVQGAWQVKQRMPNSVFVFIHAPDMATLETRLRGRGTDSEAVIQKRLENARREIEQSHWYDYQVVNDQLDRTVGELVAFWTGLISGGV